MTDQTLLERCAIAAFESDGGGCRWDDTRFAPIQDEYRAQARAVIQTIIDNTPSSYAIDELTRILGEA